MKEITTLIYPQSPGIYEIKNIENGKVYIGSTCTLYKRLIHHRSHLRKGNHKNKHLQNAYNKYGEDCFKITILEECDRGSLFTREEHYCKKYNELYNIRTIEETSFGFTRVHTDESRKKMSDSKKGVKPSNFKDMRKSRWRKIIKLVDGVVDEIFDSCAAAARSIGMKPNAFHAYIGINRTSKHIPINVEFKYES